MVKYLIGAIFSTSRYLLESYITIQIYMITVLTITKQTMINFIFYLTILFINIFS